MASLELNLDEYYEDPEVKCEIIYNYRVDKAYIVMKDFLQPDSTMCLETAANALLALLSDNGDYTYRNLVGLLSKLAMVIPWHHTSHLKLAWLVDRLQWSDKLVNLSDIRSAKDAWKRNAKFGDEYAEAFDNAARIGDDSPQSDIDEWVNFNAHLANLDALNIGGCESMHLMYTLPYAFKDLWGEAHRFRADPNDEESGRLGRDAYIMGAAQWILWDGQKLRRLAIYKGPPKGSTMSDETYFEVETRGTTEERWQFWQRGFKDAAEEVGVSQECKDVALRAFRLMETLELCMPS